MTTIEWTEKPWEPITECTDSNPQFYPERLKEPLERHQPTMWLVSDLFHDSVTDNQLDQIFAVMALTPQHKYQVITERPKRMVKYFDPATRLNPLTRFARLGNYLHHCHGAEIKDWPLPNVGITVDS